MKRSPRKPPPEYFDEGELHSQYLSLFRDISSLRLEIASHRRTYLHLLDDRFIEALTSVDSEIEYERYAPALTSAAGRGSFSMAIAKLSEESREVRERTAELQARLAPSALFCLARHVSSTRSELKKLRKSRTALERAELKTRNQINSIRITFPSERLEKQRARVRELYRKIRQLRVHNTTLRKEIEQLKLNSYVK
jgi:cell division protein FtsB